MQPRLEEVKLEQLQVPWGMAFGLVQSVGVEVVGRAAVVVLVVGLAVVVLVIGVVVDIVVVVNGGV